MKLAIFVVYRAAPAQSDFTELKANWKNFFFENNNFESGQLLESRDLLLINLRFEFIRSHSCQIFSFYC